MKFFCSHCNTKYQIADEKVSGKSMKMRCRKCGEMIFIKATKPSSDVSKEISEKSAAPGTIKRGKPLRPPIPSPQMRKAEGETDPELLKTKARVDEEQVTPPQRNTQSLTLSELLPEGKRKPPPLRPSPSISDEPQVGLTSSELMNPDSLKEAGMPSLPPIAKAQEKLPEWHIGQGGEVKGPFRQSELTEIFKQNQIDRESFVWRDGMSAWRQVKEVKELEGILKESVHPITPPEAPKHSGLGPGVSGLTPSAPDIKIHDPGAEEGFFESSEAKFAPQELGGNGVDSGLLPLERKRSTTTSLFAVAALLVFGLASGYFIWGGENVRVVEKVVEVEKIVKVSAPPLGRVPSSAPPEIQKVEVTSVDEKRLNSDQKKVTRVASSSNSRSASNGKALPIAGLEGLSSLSGPSAGPRKKSAEASGGPGLTSSQVQGTVAKHRASINRRCWQPALQARSANAANSARVTVMMSVNHEGKVTATRSSGAVKGYPGLDSCIASKSRYWRFPRSGKSQTVNIPFIFAAQ